MNFKELGDQMNISGEGARKRVLKYKDNEELKPFIEYNEDRIIGLKEEGIEVLRNLGSFRRSFSKEKALSGLKHELALKEAEIASQRQLLQNNDRYIGHLEGEIAELKDQNTKLRAELEAFKGMSFWKRLTHKF